MIHIVHYATVFDKIWKICEILLKFQKKEEF